MMLMPDQGAPDRKAANERAGAINWIKHPAIGSCLGLPQLSLVAAGRRVGHMRPGRFEFGYDVSGRIMGHDDMLNALEVHDPCGAFPPSFSLETSTIVQLTVRYRASIDSDRLK